VDEVAAAGCNVLGLGEMGIGNTSAAALLLHCLTGHPLAECVGRGTGLDAAGLARKQAVLAAAVAAHPGLDRTDPLAVLATFGGFENDHPPRGKRAWNRRRTNTDNEVKNWVYGLERAMLARE